MSNEVRNDYQASQDAYRQKLEDLRDNQDNQVNRIKEKNNEAAAKEREAGAATINHIREETRQRVEALKNDGDNRIENERSVYDRRLKETRRQHNHEIDSIQDTTEARRDTAQHQIAEAEMHSAQEISKDQFRTQQEAERLEAKRAEMIRRDQADLEKSREAVDNEKARLQTSLRDSKRRMSDLNTHEVDAIKKEHKEAIEHQNAQDQARLDEARQRTATTLETERKNFSKREEETRAHARTVLHQEAEDSQHRMNDLQAKERVDFDKERARGTKSVEKTRVYYANAEQRLHKEGDEELHAQRDINEFKLKEQDQNFHAERDARAKKFDVEKKKAFDVYRTQLQHDDAFYKKSLAQQKEEFERVYAKNSELNLDTLQESKDKLQLEMTKQRQKTMQSLGKYSDRRDDPFYQIKSVDYQLKDQGNMYELHAKIPEKEKDNVKIIVKDDRIVMQGQKRFEDRVEDENRRLATENFQSFREEIPLEHPVMDRYITSEWKNGVLTLKIPKA